MERRKPNLGSDGEGCWNPLAVCELEAAETLAGLVSCPSLPRQDLGSIFLERQVASVRPSQDEPTTRFASIENTNQVAGNVSINLFSKIRQSGKILTEAEQEERRMRRVLANRESARQTIIRRQAMHKDLVRKAAELSEENDNLKKTQELTMKKYDSLKDRNVYFKAKLAKIKKTDPGEKKEVSKVSFAESSSFAPSIASTTFSSDQPCLVPPYWPGIHPPADAIQFHYEPRHVAPFPFLPPTTSTQQGREPMIGAVTQGITVVLPLFTCLFPFVAHGSAVHTQNVLESSSTRPPRQIRPEEANRHQLLSNKSSIKGGGKAASSMGRSATRDGSSQIKHVEAKESVDISSPSDARWKRRELMKLRNRSCP